MGRRPVRNPRPLSRLTRLHVRLRRRDLAARRGRGGHARAHGPGAPPPRPRRGGRARAGGPALGGRAPAALHHRPRGGPAAVRRQRVLARLQRRDLRRAATARRARGARVAVPHAQRHGGRARALRGLRQGVPRAPPRRVRVRALRRAASRGAAGPRSPRPEAALLDEAARVPALRLGGEGALPGPPREPRVGSGRALRGDRRRRDARAHDLQGHPAASERARDDREPRHARDARGALLGSVRGAAARRAEGFRRAARGRARGGGRGDRPAPAVRRAGRHLPERGDRLEHRDGPHGGAPRGGGRVRDLLPLVAAARRVAPCGRARRRAPVGPPPRDPARHGEDRRRSARDRVVSREALRQHAHGREGARREARARIRRLPAHRRRGRRGVLRVPDLLAPARARGLGLPPPRRAPCAPRAPPRGGDDRQQRLLPARDHESTPAEDRGPREASRVPARRAGDGRAPVPLAEGPHAPGLRRADQHVPGLGAGADRAPVDAAREAPTRRPAPPPPPGRVRARVHRVARRPHRVRGLRRGAAAPLRPPADRAGHGAADGEHGQGRPRDARAPRGVLRRAAARAPRAAQAVVPPPPGPLHLASRAGSPRRVSLALRRGSRGRLPAHRRASRARARTGRAAHDHAHDADRAPSPDRGTLRGAAMSRPRKREPYGLPLPHEPAPRPPSVSGC